jgi:hypothetical protein
LVRKQKEGRDRWKREDRTAVRSTVRLRRKPSYSRGKIVHETEGDIVKKIIIRKTKSGDREVDCRNRERYIYILRRQLVRQ